MATPARFPGQSRTLPRPLPLALLLALFLSWSLTLAPSPAQAQELYQVSTLNALLAGGYDGQLSLGELKRHGDFGIGTFEALDGEMAILDGVVYQVPFNGTARVMPDTARTPFASVLFFRPGNHADLGSIATLSQMEKRLDSTLPSPNLFYALRVDGRFSYVKTRSVPRQAKPYPPLAEVAKGQAVFEFRDVEGALIGLKCPAYANGLNVPGYHWHFLTADRTAGGHVLDLALDGLTAQVQSIREFTLTLPGEGDFLGLDISRDMSRETQAVEGERHGGGQ
jgi:acetolactate decarboxylase